MKIISEKRNLLGLLLDFLSAAQPRGRALILKWVDFAEPRRLQRQTVEKLREQ